MDASRTRPWESPAASPLAAPLDRDELHRRERHNYHRGD